MNDVNCSNCEKAKKAGQNYPPSYKYGMNPDLCWACPIFMAFSDRIDAAEKRGSLQRQEIFHEMWDKPERGTGHG